MQPGHIFVRFTQTGTIFSTFWKLYGTLIRVYRGHLDRKKMAVYGHCVTNLCTFKHNWSRHSFDSVSHCSRDNLQECNLL